MKNLSGKKLLVVGGDNSDVTIVRVAKEMGIHTIACDGHTDWKKSPAKYEADEGWDIDYSDIDAVVQKCREENVDGIMAGYSEWRVLTAAKIAEALGKPFYATSDQIDLTRSKRRFKDQCIKYGVPVAKDYCITLPMSEEDISAIEYPVIVKPTDNAGCKGITVCYNREQLMEAIEYAEKNSVSKTIIVETYMIGAELMAIYTIIDGEISLSLLNEKYISEDHDRISGLCDAVITPSKYQDKYLNEVDANIRAFLKGINAQNGVVFFQLIANDERIAAFEMGYRLNGNNDFTNIDRIHGINYMKMLIHYSLTGEMGDDIRKDSYDYGQCLCTLILYAHAGTIGKISYDNLIDYPGIDRIECLRQVGYVIPENGTTQQKCVSIKMHATDRTEMAKLIRFVHNNFIIEDESNKNLLFKPFDAERLFTYQANARGNN